MHYVLLFIFTATNLWVWLPEGGGDDGVVDNLVVVDEDGDGDD